MPKGICGSWQESRDTMRFIMDELCETQVQHNGLLIPQATLYKATTHQGLKDTWLLWTLGIQCYTDQHCIQ